MKKYFKDIKKPRWYTLIIAVVLFAFQCNAVINLCTCFGDGYYLIVPLQLMFGYLDVMIFLMIQKDVKNKDFIMLETVSILLGLVVSFIIFDDIYTSIPGLSGVFYGIVMQMTLAKLFYAVIRTAKSLISKTGRTVSE